MDLQRCGADDSVFQSCNENCGQVVQEAVGRQLVLFHQAKDMVYVSGMGPLDVGLHIGSNPVLALN
ncbi:MAG TPA: hypothetical protein VFS23_37230 [Vicinamibacterales bacterium]|nr:hypothetical protein [Vicinamibacterales bacterium]